MPSKRELHSRECRLVREELSAYVDGRSAPKDKALVESHLASCEQCAAELRQLRCLVDAMRTAPPLRPPRSFALRPEMAPARRRTWFDIWSALAPAVAGAAALVLAALFFVDYRLQPDSALTGAGAPMAQSAPLTLEAQEEAAPPATAPLVAVTVPVLTTATPSSPESAGQASVAGAEVASEDLAAPTTEAGAESRGVPESARATALPTPAATAAPTVLAEAAPAAPASLSAQAGGAAEEVVAAAEASKEAEPVMSAASSPADTESTGEEPTAMNAAPGTQEAVTTPDTAEASITPEALASDPTIPALSAEIPAAALPAPPPPAATETPAALALAAAPAGGEDDSASEPEASVPPAAPERRPALLLAQALAGVVLLVALLTWGMRVVRGRV